MKSLLGSWPNWIILDSKIGGRSLYLCREVVVSRRCLRWPGRRRRDASSSRQEPPRRHHGRSRLAVIKAGAGSPSSRQQPPRRRHASSRLAVVTPGAASPASGRVRVSNPSCDGTRRNKVEERRREEKASGAEE